MQQLGVPLKSAPQHLHLAIIHAFKTESKYPEYVSFFQEWNTSSPPVYISRASTLTDLRQFDSFRSKSRSQLVDHTQSSVGDIEAEGVFAELLTVGKLLECASDSDFADDPSSSGTKFTPSTDST
jgi:hypothetical protein